MTAQDPKAFQNYSEANPNFNASLSDRYRLDKILEFAAWTATFFGLAMLVILLITVFRDGLFRLNWSFITSYPSRNPSAAGILSPLVGSIWLLITVALVSFPLGVGAGIYLEEYASDNWLTRFVDINIANLAAVPSIIYGLLGLQLFVRWMFPITNGRSVLAGALTLSLLILPVIIIATREALRTVPDSIRQAGYALGATKWQVIRIQVFPLALPGILTGTILALSRAIGETASLITIGALTFIAFVPELSLKGLQSPFTALPIQIYNWVSRPQPEFHTNAAAAIIVLMILLLLMNTTAIVLRNKFQKARG
ncbi:phosphate ABC transporter permease PstA [Fischerella thermalis]|jgi:phosphate transport system permease protein|uniref:Phosphate transport system permease protein PstA n=1 Tax=Fischerella thermalis JSC-11 TaxID=741277 RepID=G6FNN4_9CYAN|nr:phosphate ABC transporter permease PstA [Fischerella thermalis]EHC19664.1 phosphate ABC transporter, inner membrane subunit PstA [Fischerella thermalis JSC-11]PLZ05168.1 phosphate ABC transporter, permease protein PstA [Fischerella thermalis WC1110]PLZ24389.1 phosphate ABC transporter, permease protein PstA [Fischerella thermalis WC559]PLZ25932.1 phosphate ABC transporter, permease protein PstA [Fischerella thermalis WC341]PLZ30605.1 phosphate ABC transporter, permease protein PstA [Fischer